MNTTKINLCYKNFTPILNKQKYLAKFLKKIFSLIGDIIPDCSARNLYCGGTSIKIVVNVLDNRSVINGSGSSLKYILTKSATSYGEFSRYSQKSAPSGFPSQKSRNFEIRVLTPDLRKRPCCFILVRRRY